MATKRDWPNGKTNIHGEPFGRCWLLIDWLDRHTGKHLRWGGIYAKRGFVFGMPDGLGGGFWCAFPLPRMLPGFVREHQVDELRTRAGRRESDLCMIVPLFPPGKWLPSRTRRFRGKHVNPPLLHWTKGWRRG